MNTTIYPAELFSKEAQNNFDTAISDRAVSELYEKLNNKHTPSAIHSVGVARLVSGMVSDTDLRECVDHPNILIKEALLHDIGKLAISNDILDFPGRLSDDHMEQIKAHPSTGYLYIKSHSMDKTPLINHGVRVLMSHYTQRDFYPDISTIKELMKFYGDSTDLLDDAEYMQSVIALSIADHFEARYPIHPEITRAHDNYEDRSYMVHTLPALVTASLLESSTVEKFGFINKKNGKLKPKIYELVEYCGEIAIDSIRLLP